MDAKNLAVLQQLRESMHTQIVIDPSGTPQTIAWLKVLAQSLKEPDTKKSSTLKKRKPKKPKSPGSKPAQSTPLASSHKKKRTEILELQKLRARLIADKAFASKYRDCRECGKPVHIGESIPLYPVRCERCRKMDEQIDLGIKSKNNNQFSEIKVLPGGAPGLGRRK